MKFAIALGVLAILAVCESRYMSSCDAPCDVNLYGEFPICMSDASVVCGWCAAKKKSCDTNYSITKVLGDGEKKRVCGDDWREKSGCKDA